MSGRRLLALCLLSAACASGTTAPPEVANCAWRVCLERLRTPRAVQYRVVNREPVPATVRLSFSRLENLRPRSELPVEVVVPPHAEAAAVTMDEVMPDRSVSARPVLQVDLGSALTKPDAEYLYALPFGGQQPRRLAQSYGGRDSHFGSMHYALDFAMPVGTPILAARAGEVVHVQDGFREGGLDPELLDKANVVVVGHSDGTMATYGHLRAGIMVRVGQRVEVGQLLGCSGASGLAGQPHLHFHVGQTLVSDPGRTVRVALSADGRTPLELALGVAYPPQGDAGGCGPSGSEP